MLARNGDRLFGDEMFADLFTTTGRCSVPPRIVATVMLQRWSGVSDREAVAAFEFDARFKLACGGLPIKERIGQATDPLFPTTCGTPLSRDAVALLVAKYSNLAHTTCPTLRSKTVSPHVLRHSAAMALVSAGVEPNS